MAWCEANQVDYVLGAGKNDRLTARKVWVTMAGGYP
jgi:hypothetical protein